MIVDIDKRCLSDGSSAKDHIIITNKENITYMNNILETNLHLTHAPISIKDFNYIKKAPECDSELWCEKESLDNASLYIIGKREVPVFIPRREISDKSCLILDVEVGKASFRIFVPALKNPEYSLNGFAGIKTEPEGLEKAQKVWLFAFNDKGDAVSTIGFTFDELIYYCGKDWFHITMQGDFASAITYEVLYVGESVGEKLTQRFKAHHALQDMLIEEKVISSSFDKSEELILMPFTTDSYMCTMLTGFSSENDWSKALLGDFDVTPKQISLDAEKALVHGMNPKYNRIQFKNYPFSEDGLYKSDASVFCYSIADNMILKYDAGNIIGCPETAFSSSIVGDKDGYTKVFVPGENPTERYAKKWYAKHEKQMIEEGYAFTNSDGQHADGGI